MPIWNKLPFNGPQHAAGTKYADGEFSQLTIAMNMAKRHFIDEFGREPEEGRTFFECAESVGGWWKVTIYEIQKAT